MTSDQFRASSERVIAWRELLNTHPIVAEVLVCLKDSKPETGVPFGTDALDRAAALARLEQHDKDVDTLLSLAEPLEVPQVEEEPTFGVDRSQFQVPPQR